ncbi:hypothetical protein CY34DRAFT_805927 [Suillus luteus UH-Slu-Lm8-n1]|uniref:Unplaced genomic scaffold CY34scaffold_134, whole genome shotgun sequence n=1 Tax=Suillus luteus UH-Slu-Lm8-n1 TaxID=930992 RepID=A0A0D0BE23_9AGAM|nr:hypothetical protein CY34DRAFT_805927 [Suillus luteus UH-Slu-Lm8-n1]
MGSLEMKVISRDGVSEWEILGMCNAVASVLDIPSFSACIAKNWHGDEGNVQRSSVLDIPPFSTNTAKIGMMEMKGLCNVLASVLDIPPFSGCIAKWIDVLPWLWTYIHNWNPDFDAPCRRGPWSAMSQISEIRCTRASRLS